MEMGLGIQCLTLGPGVLVLREISSTQQGPELLHSVYSYLGHRVVGKALLEAGERGKCSTWHCPGDL